MSDTMPLIEQLASLLGQRLQGVWDALAGRVRVPHEAAFVPAPASGLTLRA